jgi:Protein of unknown function (DUF3800)
MSWLLFLDESGTDGKNCPYEVRGGIALHASELWRFALSMKRLELDVFGCELQRYRKEIKGSSLLSKKHFKFASYVEGEIDAEARRRLCRSFFTKGFEKKTPMRDEFAAYGQACILMAHGIYELLRQHKAKIFASILPPPVQSLKTDDKMLSKAYVFVLERFFYFLEEQKETGIIVLDELEKTHDKKLIKQMESYFSKTTEGKQRALWVVPSPLFVASDMLYPVQAADVCIYCINWGFRLPKMHGDMRQEIQENFANWIRELQFSGKGHRFESGHSFHSYGITYIPDPYTGNRSNV